MNLGMFGGIVLAYVLFFILNGFWPAFLAAFGLFLAEIGAYLGIRATPWGWAI